MRLLPLTLTSLQVCSVVFGSYEEYVILPDNSIYCRDQSGFRRFSLSRQMSFSTGSYNSSWNNLLYACKVKVYPNGRLLHYSYPEGHTSYWFHRLKVSINFTSCNDFLTVGFIPEEITQPNLHPYELNLTCTSVFPQIINSKHRIVSLVWHTESGSIEEVKSELDVQMSAYMRFEGTFSLLDKMRRCEVGSGFWCGNETAVCVYGQMRCDQADGCFDGGTDEIGCPPIRNYTYIQPRRPLNSWSVYLPWTALGLIPLILIFALGLICAPRKSLDELDDDESQEGERLKTIFSPLTSSSTASPSQSESSSPRSIQSVALCSTADKVFVCASELTRSLSHPNLLNTVNTKPVTNENNKKSCLLNSTTNTEQRSQRNNLNSRQLINNNNITKDRSTIFNGILKPSKSRAVTFQLPEKSCEKLITDLYYDNTSLESIISTNESYDDSNYRQWVQRNSGNISHQLITNKSDNRAIPACFEMAALNVKMLHEDTGNITNHNFNPNSVNQKTCSLNVFETKQLNTNYHLQSQTNNSDYFSSNTNNNNFHQSQSSSSESDTEDVTPFRRTDNSVVTNQWDNNNRSKLNGVQIQTDNASKECDAVKGKNYRDLQARALSLSSQKHNHQKAPITVTTTSGKQQSTADHLLL
ncbi:hypothetical protein MN116_003152 [Schistosoma mekongi]|uniref:CUB domain-containing protein n=1 Tax=Schistosoma mekongi TaxID=38744 RepID=A0AAE1ZI27_SCHME|nr:hypothetical protein MN116_003152 [Schistosoma mekongi]